MRFARNIILCFLVTFPFWGMSQASPRELSPETRALISAQIEHLKNWYPVKNAEKQTAPPLLHIPASKNDLRDLLRSSQTAFPLVKEDLVLDILDVYVSDYYEDCAYLLSVADLQYTLSSEIFQSENIPSELMYLALVKSGMNPEFTSSAGALGTWQFMYSTGRLYKLRIDEYVDERREISRSSQAAAQMLHDLYRLYKDWSMAITAYSCGPGNVNKAIRKAGTSDFESIYPYLPSPERDLYPSFLAIHLLIQHPTDFGVEPAVINYPTDVDTVYVDEDLHLGQVAEVVGLDENLLCQLNPVYPKHIVPGAKEAALPMCLPLGKAADFLELKDSVYAYKDSLFFNLKPEVVEDESEPVKAEPYRPGNGFVAVDYTIKSGDNMGYISEWFDINMSEIRYWNGIHGNSIRAGQKLIVYVPESKQAYYSAVDKLSFQQKQAREGKLVEAKKKVEPAKEELKPGTYVVYTVKSGDNPWKIAKQYPGVSDQDILRWNSIDPKGLRPGQKLKIKKVSGK